MDGDEIKLLGRFIPTEYSNERIQKEILDFLPPCCKRERISVRIPPVQEKDLHPNNMEWHQDGGGPEGTTRHMVIWADVDYTFLRLSDGTEVRPEPFSVMWFNNDKVFHRMPINTSLYRWFVAIRCSGAV